MILAARAPFRLPSVVESHGWHQTAPFTWDPGSATLGRVERLAGGPARLRVRPAPGGVGLESDRPLAAAEREEAERRARRMLQLDVDLTGMHEAVAALDPSLADDLRAADAGRLLAGTSLFEDVAKAICASNTTWRGAVVTIGRLGLLGAGEGWPVPEELLRAGEGRLRAEARVGYRAPFLIDAARAAIDGRLAEVERAAAAGDATAMDARLRALAGVGPATAGFLRLLLGHFDAPFADSATIRYAAARWYDGRRPTAREVVARAAPAGRFAGIALYWATGDGWRRERAGRADSPA